MGGFRGELLLKQILRFGQSLRLMGVDASMSQMLALIDLSQYISIADVQDFYYAARALLVTRHEDLPVFDQAFSIFWRSGQSPEESQSADQSKNKRARLPKRPVGEEEAEGHVPSGQGQPDGGDGDQQSLSSQRLLYSPAEVFRQKDFGQMTWEEIQTVKRALARLKWKVGLRRMRRYRAGHRGRRDVQRLMRTNLSHGLRNA